jgi:uncharacterized protein
VATMLLTRNWLLKNARPSFPINETIEISEDLTRQAKTLIKLMPVSIRGEGYFLNSADRLRLNIKMSGVMVLTCAISLEPVDYQFNIDIDQWFSFGQEIEREDLIIVEKDELNLIDFIWENIFVSIPLKVVKKGAKIPKIQGENWRFISDDNPAKKPKVDPRLEKLKTFSKDK